MPSRTVLFLLLLLVTTASRAEGLAHTVREADVKAAPARDAATLSTLQAGADLFLGARSGAWFQVVLEDETEGWIHLLAVRYYPPTATGSWADAVSRGTRSKTTVSTGVRGLDPQRLAASQPDHVRLRRLLEHEPSRQDARLFASEGGLRARESVRP